MPRRRPTQAEERIAIARLDGSARRLLAAGVSDERAVAEVHEITRDPELLARAAGSALGSWRADPVKSWQGRDVAGLLARAGADELLVNLVADDVCAQMLRRNARGS